MEMLNGFKSANQKHFSYNQTYQIQNLIKFDILTKNNKIVPYFVVGKSKNINRLLLKYYREMFTFIP